MARRIFLHILFWLCYVAVSTYLAGSYDGRYGRALGSELIALPLLMGITYFIFYVVIPRYLVGSNYKSLGLILFLLVIAVALGNRLILYFVIYPLFYTDDYSMVFLDLRRIVWSLLNTLGPIGIATAIKLSRVKIRSLEHERELVKEKLQSELNFLRAQTNPHFLFNTLNNLYALTLKKSDQAPEAVMRLSKLLRFMLYECSSEKIPLSREVKVIQDYLELEKLRYSHRLQVTYEEDIQQAQLEIAPLLLLPLVENSFTHGVNDTRGEAQVIISLKETGGQLIACIENTKQEEATTPSSESGLGLSNVQRQLELVYPDKHILTIEDQGNWFRVQLSIYL